MNPLDLVVRDGTPTEHTLVVSEVFGPTLQGEGPSLGRPASFIRLGACNLHCSWCDTPYTWDASRYDLRAELSRRRVEDIAAEVLGFGAKLVVISGGEPLLQQGQAGWALLLETLTWHGLEVEVETNGTVAPNRVSDLRIARFNVSPKLAHGGDPLQLRHKPDVLREFAGYADRGRATLKVVCQTVEDVHTVADWRDTYGWPDGSVYVMAEGTGAHEILDRQAMLVEAVLAAGLGMTTRLHTLLWGQERAR